VKSHTPQKTIVIMEGVVIKADFEKAAKKEHEKRETSSRGTT